MVPFTGSVMSIDPSGRGRDETAYAVVKMLNGQLFVPDAGGIKGGYSEATLKELVNIASHHSVNTLVVESNMGDGMFTELLKPILRTTHPCTIEEVRHNTQKERRIIDTLEPVLNQHRLVIDPKVIRADYQSAQSYPIEQQTRYMLLHQLSRITQDRGALLQDDRLDALAIAIAYWTNQMAQTADQRINDRKEELLQEELEKFMEAALGARNQSSTWMGV
jgi:hypothetical protein